MPSSQTPPSPGVFDGLVVRWDRVAVFVAGVSCLVLSLITGLLAAFTAVGWPWPVFLLLMGVGGLASVRYVASAPGVPGEVSEGSAAPASAQATPQGRIFDNEQLVARDTRRRQAQELRDLDLPADQDFLADLRFEDDLEPAAHGGSTATAPVVSPSEQAAQASRQRREAAARDRVPTQEELREAARRVAAQSGSAPLSGTETWDPVPVPKPTYARAAVAHRKAPQALQPPVAPAPAAQTLREAARAPETAAQPEAPQASPALDLHLDDVLSRRRA